MDAAWLVDDDGAPAATNWRTIAVIFVIPGDEMLEARPQTSFGAKIEVPLGDVDEGIGPTRGTDDCAAK